MRTPSKQGGPQRPSAASGTGSATGLAAEPPSPGARPRASSRKAEAAAVRGGSGDAPHVWQFAEARAHLSDLLRQAATGRSQVVVHRDLGEFVVAAVPRSSQAPPAQRAARGRGSPR